MHHGSTFHATRGPDGSTYRMEDGVVYCRTEHGHFRMPAVTGTALYGFQVNMVTLLSSLERKVKTAHLRAGVAGALVGALVASGLWIAFS